MAKSKYLIREFWLKKMEMDEEMWTGLFENRPITRQSLIINPVILNSFSNQHESGWAIYPNIYSVIGFLTYVYLPNAFIGVIDSEASGGRFYTEDDLGDLLESYKTEKNTDSTLIDKLIGIYNEVLQLKQADERDSVNALKNWAEHLQMKEIGLRKTTPLIHLTFFKHPLKQRIISLKSTRKKRI